MAYTITAGKRNGVKYEFFFQGLGWNTKRMQDNTSSLYFTLYDFNFPTFSVQISVWVLAHLQWSYDWNGFQIKEPVPKYFSLPLLVWVSPVLIPCHECVCTPVLVEITPQRLGLQKQNYSPCWQQCMKYHDKTITRNIIHNDGWAKTKETSFVTVHHSTVPFTTVVTPAHRGQRCFSWINFLIQWRTTGCRSLLTAPKETKSWMKFASFSAWQNSVWITNALFALCPATRWWCHVFQLPRRGPALCPRMSGGGVQWTALAFAHVFTVERCLL